MNNKDINNALSALCQATTELECAFIEAEGECTETTDLLEEQINCIKDLLTTEGVDSLGRWLKAKEDEKKALKAEKDYISRRMTAIDNTMDYIKEQIYAVMTTTGVEKVKGSCGYSFTPTISEKTEVDKDNLKAIYAERIENAIREARVPAYVNVTLTASSTIAKDGGVLEGDEVIFNTIRKPSCRFTKPRAKAE